MEESAVRPPLGPESRRAWLRRLRAWTETERLQRHEDKLLLVLTLLIGAGVGLAVVAFILLTEWLGARLIPPGVSPWRRLLAPTGGALVSGLLLARYFPNARGSGIPQTKTALFLERGYIRLKTVLGKFACSALSLGSGIALGREGPTVQVGAGMASVLGRKLGLGPRRVQALVPIGTAAALAAAFNTPIAAVLFTLEEILGDLHAPVLGSIVISSATSWAVLHLVLGDEPLFHVPAYQLVHPVELGIYAVLGVAGGLASVAFVKMLLGLRSRFLRMPGWSAPWQPAVGGLVVGLLGWFVPEVLGVGYGHVGEALNGKLMLSAMALLFVLKLVATAAAYASGNAGGIFGPSLFIGAMLGGSVGSVAHAWLPDVTGSPGAYALVGMGTAFAGIVRAPMTSVIMIFEITRDYSIIVPVMIANLLAYFISERLQHEPVYEALLHQDKIRLPPPRTQTGGPTAEQAMRTDPEPLDAGRSARDCASQLALASAPPHAAWPVVHEDRFVGMITAEQLSAALREHEWERRLGDLLPVPELPLTADRFPHVHPDQGLDVVLQRMGEAHLDVLPVVSRRNVQDLLGVVRLSDIPTAYEQAGDAESVAEAAHAERTSPRALLAAVLAGLLGLFLLGGLLAHHYYTARVETAQRAYAAGTQAVREHRDIEAVEDFRTALSLMHTDPYRLALGLALERAGRDAEARVYLTQVLHDQPDDTAANLAFARLQVRLKDDAGAESSFRRAVSGNWPKGAEPGRTDAVFELVGLLERRGDKRQAVAELLRESGRTEDGATLGRIGAALLALGSARQAEDVLREATTAAPQSAAARLGLGEALLAGNDCLAAARAFQDALALDPANAKARQRAALCQEVLSLDPTATGLRSRERYARSRRLLQAVVTALEACPPGTGGDPALLAKAREAMNAPPPRRELAEATDGNLRLAAALWANRPRPCAVPESVTRVMARFGT